MKKMLRRAKELAEQADRVRELLETAPERIEQAKGIVTLTTSQLQQMRTDVQSSIAGLRADTGDAVSSAVHELNEGAPTFLRAGYAMSGVDMELGLAPRLTAHLERVEDVGIPAIRALLAPNSDRRVIHGVLSALVKAEELAASTHFDDLHYCEVSVQVGPAPTIRLRWRAEASEPEPASQPPPIPASALPQPRPQPTPVSSQQQTSAPVPSAFTQTSYFEPRSTPAPATRQQAEAARGASEFRQSEPVKTPAPAHDWKRDSLERFKKMPDLSKQRH
jgi:hypothetical protein